MFCQGDNVGVSKLVRNVPFFDFCLPFFSELVFFENLVLGSFRIGTPDRFPCGKQLGSYTGLIPCEDSSAGRQRLGHISKQGNSLLRFLLVEASQAAARCNPDWRRRYVHLMMRRQKKIAKVAMARKLAVRLYWMWRLCFMRHGAEHFWFGGAATIGVSRKEA